MLAARNLSKNDGRLEALDGLDLEVGPGEVLCLLGPNGAEKTTTVNVFLGLIRPTTGAAYVNGVHVETAPLQARRHIAYVPEQVRLYPHLSGLENLDYFLSLSQPQPPDPRYGLYNVAGNVNVFTIRSGNDRKIRLLTGSHGTLESQALLGLDDDSLAQTLFLAYRRTDGYRRASGMDKLSGSAKWFLKPGSQWQVGLILRGVELDADVPGHLTADEARVAPTSSAAYAATDGGRQRNLHASLHVDYELADGLSWSLKAYGQRFQRSRWVRFAADASQHERYEDEKQTGALSVLTLRTHVPGLDDLSLEWGVDYQHQDNTHQRFATVERERDAHPLRDHAFTFDTSGESENVGETLRRGFDLEATAQPLELLTLWASLSHHLALQVEPGRAFPERKGKELHHVPDFSAKGDVDYQPLPALRLPFWLQAPGDYQMTKENDQGQHGAYALFNLDLIYDVMRWGQLGLQVKNLLDARYDSTVWYRDFSEPAVLHNPGDGRSIYAIFTTTL